MTQPDDTLLLTGKPVADAVYDRLRDRIAALKSGGVVPGLAVLLIGDNPASQVYVRSKTRRFKELELVAETVRLPADIAESDLLQVIEKMNSDARYHGLLVQLPLPDHLDTSIILDAVSPAKDVDGFHPVNLGHLMAGNPKFVPCTPQGILAILKYYSIETAGKHAVIIGRSNIVGKPMAALLAMKREHGNATVTICHSETKDLATYTKQADILVVAAGQAGLVTPDMVKPGVDIIDVGMNRIEDDSAKGYHLTGDVALDEMMGIAHGITPVPGGVGLMTVAMLVSNTVLAAERSSGALPSN